MNNLGKKLWKMIEKAQGYAYISDAVEDLTDRQVKMIAETALLQARMVVQILEKFLREN